MAPSILPPALREIYSIGFDDHCVYNTEIEELTPVDFEPNDGFEFEDPKETAWWFRLWTDNEKVDGSHLRVFGKGGSGDYFAFWLVRPGVEVAEQPVVMVGSEGELGVIAKDLDDLLWVFANGSAPLEALEEPGRKTDVNEEFQKIAQKYAPGKKRTTAEIVSDAQEKFPDFEEVMQGMCC